MRLHLALIPWIALAAAPLPARADVAPDPLAGLSEPRPMDAKAAHGIAMKREEVTIELHDGYAIVDATFTMANPAAARELQVGFPGRGVRLDAGFAVHRELVGFAAWVNGRPVPSAPKELVETYDRRGHTLTRRETWHVFTAPFAGKGETLLRVRYGVVADPYTGGSWSSDEKLVDSSVWYILATGARWEGPIGEAVLKIRAKDGVKPGSVRIRDGNMPPAPKLKEGAEVPPLLPPYGIRDPEGATLRRTNLEPSTADNVQILFRPDPARLPRGDGYWDTRAATERLFKAMGVDAKEVQKHP